MDACPLCKQHSWLETTVISLVRIREGVGLDVQLGEKGKSMEVALFIFMAFDVL
jgi:hypothetical protein